MRCAFLKLALILVIPGAVFAQYANVAPDLQVADPEANVNVIVQFREAPTAAIHQSIVNAGGVLTSEFHSINGGVYSIPARLIAHLAADPNVLYVSPDRKLQSSLDNSAYAVNAPTAWKMGLGGAGIGIALIDSGVSPHEDLISGRNRIAARYYLVGGGNDDQYGHGEHVAGIIAGNGSESICSICTHNFIGIAPKANLISIRVLDKNGEGTDSKLIAAIEMAIKLKAQYGIRVINLSLGRPIFESYKLDPICQAVEAAWKAGIVVVVAAGNDGRDNSFGNDGYGTIEAPANDPFVIAVGAMKSMGTPQRTDDLIASYSSKGPTLVDHIIKPDLVAPGNLVVSLRAPGTPTLETDYPQNDVPLDYYEATRLTTPSAYYYTLSGTSMATPVVSGAVALLLEAHPTLTPDQVKARLMRTAYRKFPESSTAYDPTTHQSFTSYYDIFTVGAGYLDIAAALEDKTEFKGTALSPVAKYNTTSATITCSSDTVCSNPALWAIKNVWGDQMLSANRSIWANRTIWGNRSIWGNSTVEDAEATKVLIYGEH